ncbi:hypothetical protein EAE96_005667 [Botrytis aclada]|nr:hypothetical protein EAE96_005667 [Botrytis aclada]
MNPTPALTNTKPNESPPSNPPSHNQNHEHGNRHLKLVPLSITEHLDDFWEIWREEREVLWTRQAPMKTREEAREFLKFILPRTEENPGGGGGGGG